MPSGDKQIKNRGGHRWKKGETGNPKGRPKKADCLVDCIKSELGKKSLNGKTTNEELIASVMVAMATKGNLKAIELVLSYTAVKPVQKVDLEHKGEVLANFVFQLPDGSTLAPGQIINGH